MQFKPDARVIDLLVGQLLYSSPDAAMRELIQNAEDACSLQRLEAPEYSPSILVRYSESGNWVEVTDNGIGMNSETVDRSFTAIGASKDAVPHIRELLQKGGSASIQIGRFGVGILSCFGVADTVRVHSKMDNFDSLAFEIVDIHAEFVSLAESSGVRGTTIRLQLKSGGPMSAAHVESAVNRYVRHAAHVELENADNGIRRTVQQHWYGADAPGATEVVDEDIEGWLALHPAWESGQPIPPPVLCVSNGGFLVKDRELNLLPREVVGYIGEINVRPGRLEIQLNREAFIQDGRWQAVGSRLKGEYNKLLRARIDVWEGRVGEAGAELTAVEQAVIVLTKGPTRGALDPDVIERLDQLLPRVTVLRIRSENKSAVLMDIVKRSMAKGVIYYVREGEAPRQFQQSVSQGSTSVQITELAQTEEVRVAHLRAKGEMVVICRQRNYPVALGDANQNVGVHDVDLLTAECSKAGIRVVNVSDASAEDVALEGRWESALIGELLGVGSQLKLVELDENQGRVIRDFAGKLLNTRHPEIREILRYIPDAVGSPVRLALLQIYMDLDTWNIAKAQAQVRHLLTLPDFAEQAQFETGPLLRKFLEDTLQPILGAEATKND